MRVSDQDESVYFDSWAVNYYDNNQFSIDLIPSENITQVISDENTENPRPMRTLVEVEIMSPQTVMLKEWDVYEGDIRIPSFMLGGVTKLQRNEELSRSEQLVWGEEYEDHSDSFSDERMQLIEQHFPIWAARIEANIDRSIADILDDSEYQTQRSEELLEFLERVNMSIEEYLLHTSMTEEEFFTIYGMMP